MTSALPCPRPLLSPAPDQTVRALAFGPIAIAFASDDADAEKWLLECLQPWFLPTSEAAECQVRLSSSRQAYANLSARIPADAERRACFAFDQRVLHLPTWVADGRLVVADLRRSCFLSLAPSEVEVIGDSSTPRWRMSSMWVFHELAATRLRRTQLELHAAAVEAAGRALLISGPKGAGKTTLSLYLMRSGGFRPITNDRAFVGGAGAAFLVRGLPAAVRILPRTVSEFPEVRRGIPAVERPYLYTVDELGRMKGDLPDECSELTLSPVQLAHQLRVQAIPSAPLGAVVFPGVHAEAEGWRLERLDKYEIAEALENNLFGNPLERETSTIFEELDGGRPSPQSAVADAISAAVPGYRLILGRNAYQDPDLASRLLEIIHPL
jgi:hypothetical protein